MLRKYAEGKLASLPLPAPAAASVARPTALKVLLKPTQDNVVYRVHFYWSNGCWITNVLDCTMCVYNKPARPFPSLACHSNAVLLQDEAWVRPVKEMFGDQYAQATDWLKNFVQAKPR